MVNGVRLPKRILIVDDSRVIRECLRELLEQQRGWEVCGEAANGREGIEKAQQLKPDVIVLDLSMPVMNGLEAACELTRLLPSVPLLMWTDFETTNLKRKALSAGVRTIVSKAESPEGLVGMIVPPSSAHPLGVLVIRADIAILCELFVAEGAFPVLLDNSLGSGASASRPVIGVLDIPLGDADRQRAALQVVSVWACSVGGPSHNRRAICTRDSIHCDEVSWLFSCDASLKCVAVEWK
jgi:CheY-like chemotaxis protein